MAEDRGIADGEADELRQRVLAILPEQAVVLFNEIEQWRHGRSRNQTGNRPRSVNRKGYATWRTPWRPRCARPGVP